MKLLPHARRDPYVTTRDSFGAVKEIYLKKLNSDSANGKCGVEQIKKR